MYGVTNGKIIKRKNKYGDSYNFLIVHNRRDGYGRAGYDTVWNFGTVRGYEMKDRANEFWQTAEKTLQKLVDENVIYRNDADKIRKQFAAYIPVPVAAPAMPAAKKINPSTAERVQARFKNLM